MAEKGQVIDIHDDIAVVRMVRTEACAKCRACVAGMSEHEMFIDARNECNASIDDWVEVVLHDNGFFSAVMIMYGIPLIGLLVGVVLGYFVLSRFITFINKDIMSLICGLLGVLVGYMWIKKNESRWEAKKYRPIAARITDSTKED